MTIKAPPIKAPLLAGKFDPAKQRFPVLASPKIDGVRCLAMNGRAMSRAFKELPSRHVQEFFARYPVLNGMDGEIVVGSPAAPDVLRTTVSHVMADDKVFEFTYVVFDRWDRKEPYDEVQGLLDVLAMELPPNVVILPSKMIYDMRALEAYEEWALNEGYEGIMLRDPKGLYKQGRSSTREGILLKVKRYEDAEAVVIGTEEEMHNANVAEKNELGRSKRSSKKDGMVGKGTVGALIVRGLNGKFKDVEFDIGTGLNAKDRADEWPVGTIVTYKFFAVGTKDKPRHPVYKARRSPIDM